MTCTGRGAADGGHCCWIGGRVCDYLEFQKAGRRWACGLFLELGSWEEVHADPRYEPIAAHFNNPTMCGDWQPRQGECCLEDR